MNEPHFWHGRSAQFLVLRHTKTGPKLAVIFVQSLLLLFQDVENGV